MLRVGLTGSIAVGKSFVASVFAELGCHVLDADVTAREVVVPGSAGLSAVAAAFGNSVIQADGTLDRARLGEIVFAEAEKRSLLNSILHPFIIARQDEILREWEKQDPESIGIVDAALMIESGGYKRFDNLVVVHCDAETQIQRVMERNHLTRAAAEQRINTQMSQEEKKKFADFLIDTSNGFGDTRTRVEEVYAKLRHQLDRPPS
jgi:dephospho-CoA kinase